MVKIGSSDPKEGNSCSVQLLEQLLATVDSPTVQTAITYVSAQLKTPNLLQKTSHDVWSLSLRHLRYISAVNCESVANRVAHRFGRREVDVEIIPSSCT